VVKCVLILSAAVSIAIGQTGSASISGKVLDAKTLKPIPAALVMAVQTGLPPFSKNTKTGGDGAFQIQGLPTGKYSLCVQAGDGYVDTCQWSTPTVVTLAAGQTVTGTSIRLTAASILTVQVQDAQKVLSQKTKDGRRPELTLGVWGPKGLYYPARAVAAPSATGARPQGGVNSYSYQVGVPRDTALKFYIASKDLKLGDAVGATLAGNASQQAFTHATGDANPKSFAFTVLGLLP
jgi:hypothetical protein